MKPMDNYKAHSLGRLTEWLHDCMSAGGASPKEIYDTIVETVREQYYYYKNGASETNELLQLLNGNGKGHISIEDKTNPWYDYFTDDVIQEEVKDDGMRPWGHSDLEYGINNSFRTQDCNSNIAEENTICDKDDLSAECKNSWNRFWQDGIIEEDKVVKWQLPIEQRIEDGVDDYYVQFPDDLLEAANLKAGDEVEWVDNKDGTYTLRHIAVSNTLGMGE